LFGVDWVDCVFGVDEGVDFVKCLCLGDDVVDECCFVGGFWVEDLDDLFLWDFVDF